MNKFLRLIIPFIVACLMVGMVIWLMGSPDQALASRDSISKSWVGKELTKRSDEPLYNLLVTTLQDELNTDGDCSLREAITAANDNTTVDACPAGDAVITDTITFDVAGTITVTSQFSVTAGGPIVIDGGEVITTSGGGTTRVWWVETGSELTLKKLAVMDGYIFFGNGGGIFNEGTLAVINSILSGNNASNYPSYGGAIFNGGTLTVTKSILSGNIASYGGAINNTGILAVTNSTLSENSAGGGGAISNGYSGTVTVTTSALFGNEASVGGAIRNEGMLTVTNSTLSGNNAIGGKPPCGGGIGNFFGVVLVTNSTLSGNYSGNGHAICSWMGGGEITAINTIVASNFPGSNCIPTITDGGHNISSDDTCGFDPANGSMPNTDPLLGPLQDNGGPTWTHALLPDSPAIDAGDDAQCPHTDQRGVPRPQDGNGDGEAECDIGSYELKGPWVSPTLITITGPSEALPGPVIYFTATVEPVSTTLPLTYVWQASGHPPITETKGLTDTVGWTWEVPGSYAITVTASNMVGSVSDNHEISISAPLYETYLPLIHNSNEPPTGSNPTFSLSNGGAIVVLVVFGMVGMWKKR